MTVGRRLPEREQVFAASLARHGYRLTRKRHTLKRLCRYLIPSTPFEDASGIDFWIKLPKQAALIPVQVTQLGIAQFRRYHAPSEKSLRDFSEARRARLAAKRRDSARAGIAFVLVPDFEGQHTTDELARADTAALLAGVEAYARAG